MEIIQPPIFVVDETACAEYFMSIQDAIRSIESVDVELVQLYDAQGRIINLDVEGESRTKFLWFFEAITLGTIHPVPSKEFDVPALRKALIKTLSVLKQHPKFVSQAWTHEDLEQISLPLLIEQLVMLVSPGQ